MKKNQALLSLILQDRLSCTITELMKIAYLVDLGNKKNSGNKISTFQYVRYNYGPFDKTIYTTVEELLKENIFRIDYIDNPRGEEIIKYSIGTNKYESIKIIKTYLSEEEINFAKEMIHEFEGLNASNLTSIAYQTEPMRNLGATLGGTEHFMTVVL